MISTNFWFKNAMMKKYNSPEKTEGLWAKREGGYKSVSVQKTRNFPEAGWS
jgi:hypothetical protein